MNIINAIAYVLIVIAASFAGAGISAIGVLAWNGFAYLADLSAGSISQAALVGGGLSFVIASALLATIPNKSEEDE